MNQQGQHVVAPLRGPSTNTSMPFYPYSRTAAPPRPNNLANAGYPTPTLTLQQGSTLVQNQQMGPHPVYTVYMKDGNGSNQNLQNRPASIPQLPYTQYQPGQEVVHQTYQPQYYQYQTGIQPVNIPGGYQTLIQGPQGGWAVPQQMYAPQTSMYQGPAPSTMQQPPPQTQPQQQVQQTAPPPKRERHPLAIVDPTTQKNILEDEINKRKKQDDYSKESTSSTQQQPQQTTSYQHQQPPPQVQTNQQNSNFYNNQQNVNYQKSNAGDDGSSQTNSRGQTPLSRSVTPTDTRQNYSPGPPTAPNIVGSSSTTSKPVSGGLPVAPGSQNEQDASQKVYCELALNIARQTCVSSTTPPPPTSMAQQDSLMVAEETPSASQASITLPQKQSQTVFAASKIESSVANSSITSLPQPVTSSSAVVPRSFAAAASKSSTTNEAAQLANERKPKEILDMPDRNMGVEKSDVGGVSFGFFDSTNEDSTLSNDDTLPKTPLQQIIETNSNDEIITPAPTSTSTPVKDDVEERKANEQSPELRVTPLRELPTVRVSTPIDNDHIFEKPLDVYRESSTERSTKSTTDNDVSLEEGEIKDADDGAESKNAYETEINSLRSLRTTEMWSIENPEGKKCYGKEYMYAVAALPLSKGVPECIKKETLRDVLNDLFNSRRGPSASSPRDTRISKGSTGGDGRNTNFQVPWQVQSPNQQQMKSKFFNGRGSTGGGGQGSRGGRGGGNKPPMIIPRASVSREVQLNKAENAWKPIRKQAGPDDPEKAKTEELYRKVKAVLNKITPQTFDDLSKDLLAMEPDMNTPERTLGVIDILFSKVCDEPGFCETYGRLCENVSNTQSKNLAAGAVKEKTQTFRYQLLIRCQQNFEMDKNTEKLKEQKLAEIAAAETEEAKRTMTSDLEETLAKHKWRTLGSIRFVGELYKRKLLTKFIAQFCVQNLLTKQDDEESIECLCKFLTTIGKTLEEDNSQSKLSSAVHNMKSYFDQLQEIMDSGQISKRIQFEIKNLMELRDNKWIPRRKEAGPKKIDEIHTEAKMEEIQQRIEFTQREANRNLQQLQGTRGSQQGPRGSQQLRQQGVPSRGSYNNDDYDNRRQRPGERDRGDRDRNAKDKGARLAQAPSPLSQDAKHIDSKSLSKHLNAPSEEIVLGPKRWAKTSSAAPTGAASSTAAKTNNRFSQLSKEERGDSAPSSRESSQTRSQANERQAALDAASLINRKPATSPETPSSMSREASPNRPYSTEPAEQDELTIDPTDDKFKQFSLLLMEEFFTSGIYDEAERLVAERKSHLIEMLQIWLENVIEKTSKDRLKLGELIARLVSKNAVPLKAVANGFDQFVQMVVDSGMETDVPLVWPYLGEILGAVIVNRGSGGSATLRLGDFHSAFQSAGDKSHDLLAHTLLTVQSSSSEQNLRDVWANESWSKYQLGNTNEVDSFLKKHNIKCLSFDLSGNLSSSPTTIQNGNVISNSDLLNSIDPNVVELERYVKSMNPVVEPGHLMDWIEANVTDKSSEEFVRALARSLCSIVFCELGEGDYSFNEDQFETCCRVLQRFISGHAHLEVALLLELTKYYYDRGCPRDFLTKMLTILSESQVVPRESFLEWWRLETESNTYGMLLKNSQIIRFMDMIDRDNESSADSSDEKADATETVIDATSSTTKDE